MILRTAERICRMGLNDENNDFLFSKAALDRHAGGVLTGFTYFRMKATASISTSTSFAILEISTVDLAGGETVK